VCLFLREIRSAATGYKDKISTGSRIYSRRAPDGFQVDNDWKLEDIERGRHDPGEAEMGT